MKNPSVNLVNISTFEEHNFFCPNVSSLTLCIIKGFFNQRTHNTSRKIILKYFTKLHGLRSFSSSLT